MVVTAIRLEGVAEAAEAAARDLVRLTHIRDATFVNLPLLYPDGSFVTVKVEAAPSGYRVSDNGFAYREAECMGAQRTFGRVAGTVAEEEGLDVTKRSIFVVATEQELARAIMDVSKASWIVADRIVGRASEEAAIELEEHVRERLGGLFGDALKPAEQKIVGASTSEWEVSAIIDRGDHKAVFQAVANHPYPIFRASTVFGDLLDLENPPTVAAVVRSKAELGAKLVLLSRQAAVIEEGDADDIFMRVAA